MADDSIEAKALALVNEVFEGKTLNNTPFDYLPTAVSSLVLLHAIEQHEATKKEFSDFRQEVSNAVKDACKFAKDNPDRWAEYLAIRFSFIITPKPKPDPLEEVLLEIDRAIMWADICAEEIRASLESRGFEIREKGQ
jgi:hypothetical protein